MCLQTRYFQPGELYNHLAIESGCADDYDVARSTSAQPKKINTITKQLPIS